MGRDVHWLESSLRHASCPRCPRSLTRVGLWLDPAMTQGVPHDVGTVGVCHAVLIANAFLQWHRAMRLPHPQYDIIIGADILLFTSAHAALVQSLRRFSSPSTESPPPG